MDVRIDCLHYKGDRPCGFAPSCGACSAYAPSGEDILIVKTGARGDVLRTTALLPGLKRRYPQSGIVWLTAPESRDLLLNNPIIHSIYSLDISDILPLLAREFDVLISLDKEEAPTAAASLIRAVRKFGFGRNERGRLVPFNPASEYALRLGLDDELKFRRNHKTYQEIVYDMAELDYRGDGYVFRLEPCEKDKAERFFRALGPHAEHPRIGLNTGAGDMFPTKQWPEAHFLELIRILHKSGSSVFLLGGERERDMNTRLERESRGAAKDTGCGHSLREFAGFVNAMDAVVSSDTLGMHLAIALEKKVVALFGPTCPREIDLYGRGVRLFAELDCSPCYRKACPETLCMAALSPEKVAEALREPL